MRLHADRDVEIARVARVAAHMAFAGDADAGLVGQARRHVDRQRLALHPDLLPAARRADGLALAAGSATLRARLREDHVAARRLHRAAAVAVRAATLGRVQAPDAAAAPAALLPRDGDLVTPAAERVVEAELDGVMQIGAARHRLAAPAFAVMPDVGEQIAEG